MNGNLGYRRKCQLRTPPIYIFLTVHSGRQEIKKKKTEILTHDPQWHRITGSFSLAVSRQTSVVSCWASRYSLKYQGTIAENYTSRRVILQFFALKKVIRTHFLFYRVLYPVIYRYFCFYFLPPVFSNKVHFWIKCPKTLRARETIEDFF